jgi:phosphoribosylformylglycinamidine cyclo-ligase
MPGFYADGEYDLAGFIVGAADRERLITGGGISEGDTLIGVPSGGLHTNGYSLARRIVFDELELRVDSHVPELGRTVGAALLEPHRSYLPLVRPLLDGGSIKGMAHITGGGITDNLPRVLPASTVAHVDLSTWRVPPIFSWLMAQGRVPLDDMLRTFNMGIGLIIVTTPAKADHVLEQLAARGGGARVIGEIAAGAGPSVSYTGSLQQV